MAQNTSQANPLGIVFAGALALIAIGAAFALRGDDQGKPQAVGATAVLAPAEQGDLAGQGDSGSQGDPGTAAKFGSERDLGTSTDGEKALGEDASPSFGGGHVRGKTGGRKSETEMLAEQAAADAEYIGNGQNRSSSAARQREARAASGWGGE